MSWADFKIFKATVKLVDCDDFTPDFNDVDQKAIAYICEIKPPAGKITTRGVVEYKHIVDSATVKKHLTAASQVDPLAKGELDLVVPKLSHKKFKIHGKFSVNSKKSGTFDRPWKTTITAFRDSSNIKKLEGKLQNEWHYGEHGSGKSTAVREKYPAAFDHSMTKWWCGYPWCCC